LLWKAAYYNRFVRPRAALIPRTSSGQLAYSKKLSKWLDEATLVKAGQKTDWKRQYKLRHNWSRGKCAMSEIPVADRPPVPPLLVRMHNGIVFTADSISGLRAWSTKRPGELMGFTGLMTTAASPAPTALAVNIGDPVGAYPSVVIGFENGAFSIYDLQSDGPGRFRKLYSHPSSSNGMINALAYSAPYLLAMDSDNLLSLYLFPKSGSHSTLSTPRLLYSLHSYTVTSPLSLSVRISPNSVSASIAYTLPTYPSGWSVGIQEMRLSLSGELQESRSATAENVYFESLSASSFYSRSLPPSPGFTQHSTPLGPTSLSYSHPYLLASHPDNTLTLYLVTSTASSLFIGRGSRLWGHTSSVSGAHIGGRGKAVSVSRQGDELRVWELEGGIGSSRRKRLYSGELSIRIRPEQSVATVTGLDLIEHNVDDASVTRGWVGFDEENVVVLKEKSQGAQALVVYDFT
jgi:hypothetical protein